VTTTGSPLHVSVPDAVSAPPALSLVVPTFNEAANIDELLSRICAALPKDLPVEVLFVDDSTDNTPEVIADAALRCAVPVAVHHRAEAKGGLGGAVIEGIARTTAPWVVVMDADLQHPPQLVPELIGCGEQSGAELVVASRYADGGSRGGLAGTYRRLVSGSSTALAKAAFPRVLRGISDPMSGFFAIRRTAVDRGLRGEGLRPLGYKILLELAVRCRPNGIAELPYEFGERFAGESKSTLREGLRFLRHLVLLRCSDARARMVVFGLIGASGFLPNLALLWLLIHGTGMHYVPAEVIANQAGLFWNFLLMDSLVYQNHRRHRSRPLRFLNFAVLGNVDLVARIPLLALLVTTLGIGPVTATAISLVLVFALRYLIVDRLLYLKRSSDPALGN
jgi:dolichol-phosphate mannosyltransferase